MSAVPSDAPSPAPVASTTPAAEEPQAADAKATSAAAAGKPDAKELTSADYYFDSYSHFGIHEEMLKDTVRTKSYMRSIVNNKHLFKDKVVLDVGCGTGILSMFAARAGAKHVYGVDCAGIIEQAKQIVELNGLSSAVTLIRGKIEEVELPVDKVDIIISEWMGYFLLYESMLDTVLFARDKWLAKDGMLFPDRARLYVCAIEDSEYREDKINFWDNVYGFNMEPIKSLALLEPLVDVCEAKQVMSNSATVLDVDIHTVKKEELDFTADWTVEVERDDYCHAIIAYFDVDFSKCHSPVRFSTGPRSQYTHWKQTVFYLDEPIPCRRGDTLRGSISVKRNAKNPRDLDIVLSTKLVPAAAGGPDIPEQSKLYRLR